MTTLELSLFPSTQLKRPQEEHHLLLHHHPPPQHQKKQKVMTMLSYIQPPGSKDLVAAGNDDGNSWEVRAFAEDTNNILGCTWPPRFYTCSFCRREFRSAQALGGHMNVHRRDRVRAQTQPRSTPPPVIFTEVAAGGGGGFCFVSPMVAGSGHARPSTKDSSSSTFFSLSSASHNNAGTISFGATASDLSLIRTSSDEHSKDDENGEEELIMVEEVDLELRLGW